MLQTINSEGQAPSVQTSTVQEITVVSFLGEDIRVLGTPQDPLFIASDVARWIDQPKAESVCRMLDKAEAIKVSISSKSSNGTVQKLRIVSAPIPSVVLRVSTQRIQSKDSGYYYYMNTKFLRFL